jgi:hypothetical protein
MAKEEQSHRQGEHQQMGIYADVNPDLHRAVSLCNDTISQLDC